jgi:two-component system NtrC family response regulator
MLQGEFGKIDKNMREQLSVALKNSRQLMKLIDQLLDFSMLESGKRTYIYEKRDLNNLTAAILDSFTFISKKKKINLTFAFNSETPYISIDPVKVEKVLYDIIGNAFKFTPDEGSITITIDDARDLSFSSSADKGDYTKIAISDTGKGIKKEHLGLIFDRFKQGRDDFPLKDIGYGIGLAHAKELIEHMGGEITVTSEYGKGSTFTIYLPAQKEELDKAYKNMAGPKELLNQPPEIELSDIHLENPAPEELLTGKKPLILIVDDNLDVINYVSSIVKKEYDFITAQNGEEGLNKLKRYQPDLILCDIMMPEMDGCEFLKRVRSNSHLMHIPIILLTARADEEMEIECLADGADDYIVKPFNSFILLARIKSLLRIRNLMSRTKEQEKKINTLTKKLQGKFRYGNIIGSSLSMRKIYELLETIKESDATVLIAGETGTGKELIANSIHYNSKRKSAPMISVNCGAIPKELVEREFFGHVKGAYTGAFETRKGYFEEADGGTLFLDEIGTMDNDMQVKLLRVLERGEIVKVGNSTPTKIDVRLIAATNKDLLAEVRKGTFREDLYYRIHVIPINVPPLKHRREDIPLLIEHFIKSYQSRCKKKISDLSQKEMDMLMTYTYPGNVRELENIIERYCLLGTSVESLLKEQPTELTESLPHVSYETLLSGPNPLKAAAQNAKARAEKEVIMHALKISDNDNKKAAQVLNIGLSSLYRKLKECNNF